MLEVARGLVRDQFGLDFPSRRDADLERALSGAGEDPRALVDALRAGDPAWRALIAGLTVQESYFFRDAGFYRALGEQVLPRLIAA